MLTAWKHLSAPWLMLAIVLLWSTNLFAQPQVVPNGKSGFKLTIPQTLFGHRGKGVVSFTLAKEPVLPSRVDQMFTITVQTMIGTEGESVSSFSKQVVLPAGATSISGEVLVDNEILSRNDRATGYAKILVERGRGNAKLDQNDWMQSYSPINRPNRSSNQKLIYLKRSTDGSSAAAKRELDFYFWEDMDDKEVLPAQNQTAATWNAFPPRQAAFFLGADYSQLQFSQGLQRLDFQSLPESWAGLDCIRQIAISFDDLEDFCEDEKRRKKLERWLAGGGQLIVAGQNNFDHTSKIMPALTGNSIKAFDRKRWTRVELDEKAEREFLERLAKLRTEPTDNSWQGGSSFDPNITNEQVQSFAREIDVLRADQNASKDSVLMKSNYVAGTIYSIDGLRTGSPDNKWHSMLQQQLAKTRTSTRPESINNLLNSMVSPIPGVGNPPAKFFLVMLFGFLVLIGPIMIFIVRIKRATAHRLFFAVPVISFLTCVAILGYSYFSNLGRQAGRVDSITIVDPSTGMAFNQTVLAYFCGGRPGYYEYDEDVLVFSQIDYDDELKMEFGVDGRQKIQSDRIAARRLHFLTIEQVDQVAARLEVRDGGGVNAVPKVFNQLGGRIKLGLIRWKDKIYRIDNVDEGTRADVVEVQIQDLADELMATFPAYTPESNMLARWQASIFSEGVSSQVRSMINQAVNSNDPDELLKSNGDFLAVVNSDPIADQVSEPYNYKMKHHLIYGRH